MALPELLPEDRVLLTAPIEVPLLREIAGVLTHGRLVVLAEGEDLAAGRRQCQDLENLMFTMGSREQIPWRTHSFNVIIDARPEAPSPEMVRVLFPGGRILPPGS